MSILKTLGLSLALAGGLAHGCQAQEPPQIQEPQHDTIWTSTREVRALKLEGFTLWAATAGGVLRYDLGQWTKWTRRDELPSHEAVGFSTDEGEVHPIVRFPRATAGFDGANWNPRPAPVFRQKPLEATLMGATVRAELAGLRMNGKFYALPKESRGTHISALWDVGHRLLVAIYGDGVWSFDGDWVRAPEAEGLPSNAREITAIACDAVHRLWVGTRRDGIFYQARTGDMGQPQWRQFLQPDEPYSHNVQSFAAYGGALWASTLDDGLVYRTAGGWKSVTVPDLSSSAPRQLLTWKGKLWVRHGGGTVDSFDGQNWTKNALKDIPRPSVYALAGDEQTLLASGWGGWSEWDGQKWTPHYDVPELKSLPILGIITDEENVWLATQSRGLGRWNRQTGAFRWFDERDGLSDDWVTTLAESDGKIYAGTFVGGLARLDGETWHVFPQTRGLNVTSIAPDGQGAILAATRHGLWKIVGDSATKVEKPWLDDEIQALYRGEAGWWVGARTSIDFCKDQKINVSPG